MSEKETKNDAKDTTIDTFRPFSTTDEEASNPNAAPPSTLHQEQAQPQTDTYKLPSKKQSIHRKSIIKLALAGLFVVILTLIGAALVWVRHSEPVSDSAFSSTPDATSIGAALTLAEGAVERSLDGETWLEVEPGATFYQLNYIRTDETSRAVITFDEGSAIRLDNNTTVRLAKMRSDTIVIENMNGEVYSRVIASENRSFSVKTSNETFLAHGTAYKTTNTEEREGVEVYQSSVEASEKKESVEEGKQYYKKNTTDTEQEGKVTDIDLETLKANEFIQWNLDQDEKTTDYQNALGILGKLKETTTTKANENKEDTTPSVPNPNDNTSDKGISFSAAATSSGISFSWSVAGVTTNDGFKIVKGTSSTPTYGSDESNYIGDSNARSATWNIADGGTYHFRICAYRASAGNCEAYSNAVQVTAPNNPPEAVQAGTVSLSINLGQAGWTFTGTAPHGFKLVMSTSPNPVYPAHSVQYINPGTTSIEMPDKSAGTYYVRICKYTASPSVAGGCTDYSNEVTYTVN